MTSATPHVRLACALALSVALVLPAGAAADAASSGGMAPTPTGGTVAPSDGSVALYGSHGALLGRSIRLGGAVPPRLAGRMVTIQRQDGPHWTTVSETRTGRDGAFSARWRSTRSGRFTLRAVVTGIGRARGATSPGGPGFTRVTVYPSAIATWYGPRTNRVEMTACGVRLTRLTLGVAHRTLPCGTEVELYYRGRSITVPVIDRGPYANGASWDLTIAAADQLGFTSTGIDRIGAFAPTVPRHRRR